MVVEYELDAAPCHDLIFWNRDPVLKYLAIVDLISA